MIAPISLSPKHIAEFQRDGCLVLRRGFGERDMAVIESWAREVAEMPEVPGRHWVFHEKSRMDERDLISRIENIAPFHPGFSELAEILKPSAAQLLGEDAILFKEKINFKMPGGDGFAAHQDAQAGWQRYASHFVSVMVCIDEATVENGCLEIAPGHHRRGLLRGMEPLTEADTADMDFLHCPTSPGDLIFFDAFCPHRSAPNFTDQTRRLYFATYNRASEGDHMTQYYADKHRNYPPDIERDPQKTYVFKV